MVWDALSLLVPDIFIDTMGYAFALSFAKLMLPHMPTAAYVHYPTISTDMIESLDPTSPVGSQGVNAGQGTGLRGMVKGLYWRLFAHAYGYAGSFADVVMTNSSWTESHISRLWALHRRARQAPIAVIYPPVAVREIARRVEVSEASEARRRREIVCIAQFRPEKNHNMVMAAFAELVKSYPEVADPQRLPPSASESNAASTAGTGSSAASDYAVDPARLVLVGSVRDAADQRRVYELRLYANELGIRDRVVFQLDASWNDIIHRLGTATVGVNAMWNEHFGIGVAEYQAAGLIAVVHDSGGPKMDIVTDVDGEPTGESPWLTPNVLWHEHSFLGALSQTPFLASLVGGVVRSLHHC